MSGTNSTMHLGIDASGAKQGADQFTGAITKIAGAVDKLDKTTDIVFSKIKARLQGLDFSKVARDVQAIGSIKVDASVAGNLTKLSHAIASFKPISPQTTSQLSAFAKAIAQFHNPSADPTKLHALAQAVAGFRAPSQQQTANLQAFVHGLNSIRITANVPHIVAQLQAITAAAAGARTALAGIGPTSVGTPRGLRSGGSGGGGGGRQYGPRGPYDGVFSGNQRATGELRGLENVANPSFQAASVLRAAVPALTSGAFIHALYEEGQALTAFQHTLEIATTVPNNAIESQQRLGDAMQFVSNLANKYGLNLAELRQGFGLFAATAHVAGYTMGETKKVYEDTASSLRAVGASTEKQAQVWRALDTIMSQGFVSMIQLHRQIAPALPGVQVSMAEVLYRAKNKLAEDYQLTAKQMTDAQLLLNELSRKKQITPEAIFQALHLTAEKTAAGLPTALASPQSALERFKTQWLLTLDEMNKNGVWDTMGAQFNRFADMLRRDDIQGLFKRLAQGIAEALKMMGDGVEWAANHLGILVPLLKAFVMIGAAEAALRLAGAFSSLGGLITTLVSPLASVVRLSTELIGVGLDLALGKVAAKADLAAMAMRGMDASVNLAMTATVLAAAASTAVMVANENEMSALGNQTQTFGQHMETMWEMAKEGGSQFGTFLLELGKTFGILDGNTTSWADVIEQAMISIGTAVANLTINLINDMRDVATAAKNLPTTLGRMFLTEGAAKFLGLEKPAGAEHIPNITRDQVAAGIVQRTNDDIERRKRIAAMNDSANFSPPVIAPEYVAPKRAVIGDAAPTKGKSAAEKAQDALDNTLKSLTAGMAMVERFEEEVANIAKAKEMGVHSKGALALAKSMSPAEGKAFLAGEYDRALQSAKDKLLETTGAVTPYEQALKKLSKQEHDYTALVALGLITQEKKNQLMAQATEHLAKQLDPYKEYVKNLDLENSLLLMGNKQREVQVKLDEMIKQAKADGKPLDDAEIATLKQKLVLHQQLQQYAANQNVGLQAWANSFQDLYTELGKVEQKIAGDLSSALTKFITDGVNGVKDWKKQLQDLGKSILNDVTKVMVNSLMRDGMKALGLIDQQDGADPKGASFLPQLFGVPKPGVPGQPGTGGGSWLSNLPIIGKLFGGGGAGASPNKTNSIEGAMAANGGALPVVVTGKTDGVGGPDVQSQFDKTAQSAANDNTSGAAPGGSSNSGGIFDSLGKLFNGGGMLGTLLGAGGGALGGMLLGKKSPALGALGGIVGGLGGKLLGSLFNSGSSSSGTLTTYGDYGATTMLGGLWDTITHLFSSSGSSAAGEASSLLSSGIYSEGGFAGHAVAMTRRPASSWANAPHYADGTSNTSGGMPAVLHPNEAVIPLSRGRKIPIEAANGNSFGGGHVFNINMNVITPDASSFNASKSQVHAQLGQTVQRAVQRNG